MSVAQAPATLVDGVDVEALARVARTCLGVEALYGGFPDDVVTYLPGRRLVGVRVDGGVVGVQVRAAWGVPATQIASGIRAAVAPLTGGRAVNVTIAAIGDPLPADTHGHSSDRTAARIQQVHQAAGRATAGEVTRTDGKDT